MTRGPDRAVRALTHSLTHSLTWLTLTGALQAQQPLHPTVQRWKAIYEQAGWQAYLRAVDEVIDVPGGDPRLWPTSLSRPVRSHQLTRAPRRAPDQIFWQRLSSYLDPRSGPVGGGGGGGDSVVTWSLQPQDFRGCGFHLAPYAGGHLAMFSPAGSVAPASSASFVGPSTTAMPAYGHYNSVPDAAAALASIEVQASFMARQGVNVVRVFIPFGSMKWWTEQDPTNGLANWQAFVQGYFKRLARNKIYVIVALGNTFGDDPLRVRQSGYDGSPLVPRRYWRDTAQNPALPTNTEYLVYDEIEWMATGGALQEPGNSLATNTAFLSTHWYPYINTLINTCKTEGNLLAWELFNEPDNNIDQAAVAAMIVELKSRVSSLDAGRPVVLGANSTVKMENLHTYLMEAAGTPDGWLLDNVDAMGFHIMSAVMYQGGRYLGFTSSQVGYPGFPPDRLRDDRGLLDSVSQTDFVAGVIPAIANFLANHSIDDGFIEEACTRSGFPQLFHDIDLALRNSSSSLGRMYLTPAYSTLAPWPMNANGGEPLIPRELLVLQDRYHQDSNVTTNENHVDYTYFKAIHDNTLTTSGRIYTPPTGSAGSLAMRPLILRSSNTTLVVATEPFESYPTNTFFTTYPASSYAGRNKIWVQAFRDGSPGLSSGLQDLRPQSLASPAQVLLSLSSDLRFKEVDDNLAYASHGSALRYRTSFYGIGNAFDWLGPNGVYPVGQIGIEPTWGGVGASGSLIPTLRNDQCSWTDYTPRVAGVELEMALRGYVIGRQRLAYVGVTGKVAGVDLPLPSGQSDVKGRYLLAYHRAVPKKLETGSSSSEFQEHYGPGQDGKSTVSSALTWSARYGDIYRKAAFGGNPYDQPEKYEVVLVDLFVKEISGQLSFVANQIQVLETIGDDVSDPTAPPGASGLDPLLARNSTGDVVILYRKIQDPFFEFNVTDDSATVAANTWVYGTASGRCTATQTNPTTMLPFQTSGAEAKVKWQTTANNSHYKQYPAVVAARMWRADASWFGPEVVVSEPYATPAGGTPFHQDDWSVWHGDTKNVQQSGGPPVQLLDPSSNPTYGKWISDRSPGLSTLQAGQDVHAFHPVYPASVQVGERISGSPVRTPVLVSWKQIPRERRNTWVRPFVRTVRDMVPYAVYALRLDGSTSNTLSVASSAYIHFGSTLNLVGLSPGSAGNKGYDPLLTTWDHPQVHFEYGSTGTSDTDKDTKDQRATWQQGTLLLQAQGSAPLTTRSGSDHDALGGSAYAGVRSPVSGYEPRRGLLSPDKSLRLTAWCQPVFTTSTQRIQVHCEWSTVSGSTVVATAVFALNNDHPTSPSTFDSTDPDCRVVAVVPLARTVSGAPRGRIVWQADDDIWAADLEYALSGPNPVVPVVRRVTDPNHVVSGKGKFPTLRTEVSATADVIAWTYAGRVHAVRW